MQFEDINVNILDVETFSNNILSVHGFIYFYLGIFTLKYTSRPRSTVSTVKCLNKILCVLC